MQQFGRYVVSLTAAALVSGILLSMFPKGVIRWLIQLVCGVFLTITALSPLTDVAIPDFSERIPDYRSRGEALSCMGENLAREETRVRIKQILEAYILDKAATAQAEITAEISVSDDGIPESVILTGTFSGDARQQLEAVITNDLGIPKENQQWIG